MDRTAESLVDFALSLTYADLTSNTVRSVKDHVIDSIAVAVAAFQAPPVAALRRLAPSISEKPQARIFGTLTPTTPDFAAFVNGAMVRYLDWSDAYTRVSTAHPSDNFPAILAVAEAWDRSGRDFILALTLCYEIHCRFADVVPFHQNGWDQAIAGSPAAALAGARLMELSRAKMHDALSLAVTPNLPTYQTRSGKLSLWKGLAGPHGARNGLFAAMMANAGITGPEAPFEGRYGLWPLTVGKPYKLALPKNFSDHIFAVEQSNIKLFPIRNACQLPVKLALELRQKIELDDITALTIFTNEHEFGIPGRDPTLLKPQTRESADHSLTFTIAAALLDGQLTVKTFESERYLDREVLALMDRMKIAFDPEFNAVAPATQCCRLSVECSDGRTEVLERRLEPEEVIRSVTSENVREKYRQLTTRHMGRDGADRLLDLLENLDDIERMSVIVDQIRTQSVENSGA